MLGSEVIELLPHLFHHYNIPCEELKYLSPRGTLENKWALPVRVFMTLWILLPLFFPLSPYS